MWNGAVALAVLPALSLLSVGAASGRPGPSGWALLGWSLMALVGVAGGYALEATHGRPGAGFLGALSACILTRMFGAAAGALVASLWGDQAIWAFLAGLGVAFVPLQLLEIGWFMRKARKSSPMRGSDAVGN